MQCRRQACGVWRRPLAGDWHQAAPPTRSQQTKQQNTGSRYRNTPPDHVPCSLWLAVGSALRTGFYPESRN